MTQCLKRLKGKTYSLRDESFCSQINRLDLFISVLKCPLIVTQPFHCRVVPSSIELPINKHSVKFRINQLGRILLSNSLHSLHLLFQIACWLQLLVGAFRLHLRRQATALVSRDDWTSSLWNKDLALMIEVWACGYGHFCSDFGNLILLRFLFFSYMDYRWYCWKFVLEVEVWRSLILDQNFFIWIIVRWVQSKEAQLIRERNFLNHRVQE